MDQQVRLSKGARVRSKMETNPIESSYIDKSSCFQLRHLKHEGIKKQKRKEASCSPAADGAPPTNAFIYAEDN
jgi:hypothetical protein